MKIKKMICVLLATMLVCVCCSCGEDNDTTVSENEVAETESEENTETTTETTETTILDTETEVYNANDIVITLTDIVDNGSETTANFIIENNSSKDWGVCLNGCAVNNLCTKNDVYFAESVISETKAKTSLAISDTWLTENNITEISTLSLAFRGVNSDDYNDLWESGIINVNTPLYNENNAYVTDSEQIYTDNNMDVYLQGVTESTVTIIMYNKTSRDIEFCINSDCTVNGWTYELWDYESFSNYDSYIMSGTYAIVDINVASDFISEYDIDTIEDFTFVIRFMDYASSSDIDIFDETSERITVTCD